MTDNYVVCSCIICVIPSAILSAMSQTKLLWRCLFLWMNLLQSHTLFNKTNFIPSRVFCARKIAIVKNLKWKMVLVKKNHKKLTQIWNLNAKYFLVANESLTDFRFICISSIFFYWNLKFLRMHHIPTPFGWKQNLIRKPNEMLHFMPDAQNQYLFIERNKITLVICSHILFFMDFREFSLRMRITAFRIVMTIAISNIVNNFFISLTVQMAPFVLQNGSMLRSNHG